MRVISQALTAVVAGVVGLVSISYGSSIFGCEPYAAFVLMLLSMTSVLRILQRGGDGMSFFHSKPSTYLLIPLTLLAIGVVGLLSSLGLAGGHDSGMPGSHESAVAWILVCLISMSDVLRYQRKPWRTEVHFTVLALALGVSTASVVMKIFGKQPELPFFQSSHHLSVSTGLIVISQCVYGLFVRNDKFPTAAPIRSLMRTLGFCFGASAITWSTTRIHGNESLADAILCLFFVLSIIVTIHTTTTMAATSARYQEMIVEALSKKEGKRSSDLKEETEELMQDVNKYISELESAHERLKKTGA